MAFGHLPRLCGADRKSLEKVMTNIELFENTRNFGQVVVQPIVDMEH